MRDKAHGWVKDVISKTIRSSPTGYVEQEKLIDAIYGSSINAPSRPVSTIGAHISQMRSAGVSIERVVIYRFTPRR